MTLSNVSVSDPLPGLSAISPVSVGSLEPGATQIFTASYTIKHADLDAGQVNNTATAKGSFGETDYSDTDSETITAQQSPDISITKTASQPSFNQAGEVITYTFSVTNTGNVTLSSVTVTDPLPGLSSISPASVGSLAPNATQIFTASYTIKQANLDAGQVNNTATANGTFGQSDYSDTDSETITANQSASIDIQKTASQPSFNQAGEVISYTFTVTNTGNVTLSNVSVSDPLNGLSAISPASVGSLAPGATQIFTATYTIKQADLDAGQVDNTATAKGTFGETDYSDRDSETITAQQSASIAIEKIAAISTVDKAGQVIAYSLKITNTGNTTLLNVTIIDVFTGFNQNIGSLSPGQVVEKTVNYTVTQEDMDKGSILNIATVTAQSGTTQVTDQDEELVNVTKLPSVLVEKSANVSTVSAAGEVISCTLKVTNKGNLTLSNVTIADPLTGFNQNIGSLSPGQVVEKTVNYTVTQEDMDKGSILNIATVTAQSGTTQVTDQDEELIKVTKLPSIEIVKTASVSTVSAAGDIITYTLRVTNTGNMSLSSVMLVDPLTGFSQNVGSLAPGQVVERTVSYTVTQADMDFGSIVNLATVTATSGATEVSDQDEFTVLVDKNLSIRVDKTDNDAKILKAGESITYTLTVTNSGNVTLFDVVLEDPLTELNKNLGVLAPGASISLTTSYTVTQADVDNGKVVNVAFVEAQNPVDSVEVTTLIPQLPSVKIEKSADRTSIFGAGEKVISTLKVTNTGNVTLKDIRVIDPLTGFEETIPELSPSESVTLSVEYVVTLEDMSGENLTNVATVTAIPPSGQEVNDTDSLTIEFGSKEILANDDDFGTYFQRYGGSIGNILDNDFLNGVPTNSEEVDFEFIELDGILGLLIDESGELSLIPGVNDIRAYSLEYVLRETANPANSDTALVFFKILNNDADLSITKEVLSEQVFEGDLFDYQLVVTNEGETDATDVEIIDSLPSGLTYQSYVVASNTSGSEVVATVVGNNLKFEIPLMKPGSSVTIRIKVKAGLAGTVTNTAVVGSSEDDTNDGDNTASVETVIEPFRIPNVITPNGDGKNDSFEIQGLGKYPTNSIVIFNRYGDHVFERENYGNDWNAAGLVAGTYYYLLRVTDALGVTTEFKGWIQVIKD